MKQLVCNATGQVQVVDVPAPAPGAGDLLVQMELCGVCGTDLTKVYDDSFAKPIQLGHEIVGTIVDAGRDVRRFGVGQRVTVAHHAPDYSAYLTRHGSATMDALFRQTNIDPGGFAELIRVPASLVQHTVVALPEALPDLRAVFIEPLACCVRALDRVTLREGESALVVGVGATGLLFVPLLRDRSVTVLAAEIRDARLLMAQQWGARAGFLVGVDDVAGGVRQETEGRGADLVILTVTTAETVGLALATVRDGGTVLVFGVKPEALAPIDLWQVWRREISLISTYSTTPDMLPRALAILRRPEYTLEATVSHVLPLEQAPRGFDLAHQGLASKVVISRELLG